MQELTLAWRTFDGDKYEHVRQIGIKSIVTALYDISPSAVWPFETLKTQLYDPITAAECKFHVVESLPVPDEIIIAGPDADRLIAIWCQSLKNIAKVGVEVVTYNVMLGPDWTRTHHLTLDDGSVTLAYDEQATAAQTKLKQLPGWLKNVEDTDFARVMAGFRGIPADRLWEGLHKFLNRVVPLAEELGVKLALHPDDPPWPVFGIPRIITDADALDRVLNLCDSPANGLCFCTGSLGANPDNDLPEMIRRFASRIHFAHVRNLVCTDHHAFYESPHYQGDLDLYQVMRAFHEVGFRGPMRPDHGHTIWGEQAARKGYSWPTRAMGASYLRGLWNAIARSASSRNTAQLKLGNVAVASVLT